MYMFICSHIIHNIKQFFFEPTYEHYDGYLNLCMNNYMYLSYSTIGYCLQTCQTSKAVDII